MMDFPRTRKKDVSISLIPLIDISVFLLIFFMLTGSIDRLELIPIEPPVAESGKLMDEGHLVILLGQHHEIIINDEMIPLEDIPRLLGPDLIKNPGKIITVKADAEVPANRMIEVMDAIKEAGGKNLSVVTQSKARVHVP